MSNVKRQIRKVGVAGGFINQMMGNNSTEPTVGDGATILMYSDRHAYEVLEVNEDKTECVIRQMDWKVVGGTGHGDEVYEYFSNPEANSSKIVWNEKKQCWGYSWKDVKIIKALEKKLYKEYGYGWTDYLPVPFEDLIDGEPDGIYTKFKLVKGVTKEYNNFSKVSIIFGIMEEYRDPHF